MTKDVLAIIASTFIKLHLKDRVCYQYQLNAYDNLHADMEFVKNITRTCVSRKSITPKYSVNYDFLGQEENINLPLFLP